MAVPLEAFLGWARETVGDARLVKMVHEAIQRRAGLFSLEEFLKRYGAYPAYKKAIRPERGTIEDFDQLVRCVRLLGLSITADLRCSPWDRWEPDSVFTIVYGERQVHIPEVAKGMRQRAVGARDAEAMTYLVTLLRSRFQIEARVKLYPVPADLAPEAAEEQFERLRGNPETGAIVVLGSPVVNPMAEVAARAITDNEPDFLPGRFRWSCRQTHSVPFLSDPTPCKPEDEGIRRSSRGPTYRRVRDDRVLADIQRGKYGPFADCGMPLMDCRQSPYLLLCAGHGGCGTVACVEALEQQGIIAERLAEGNDRLFELIEVKRRKPKHTAAEVDDLFIDKWTFVWGTSRE
jgi:hypothetical protein